MSHDTSQNVTVTTVVAEPMVLADSPVEHVVERHADAHGCLYRAAYSDGVYVLDRRVLSTGGPAHVAVSCRDTEHYPELDVPSGGYPVVPAAAFADDTFSTDSLVFAGRACRWMRRAIESTM